MITLQQSTSKPDVMIATVKIIKIFRFGCQIIIIIKLINFSFTFHFSVTWTHVLRERKKCDKNCLCASNDLKCTDMCSCNNCDNKTPIDETYDDESDDSLDKYSDESDSEYWTFSIFWHWCYIFIHDIWERYFLTHLRISSILDFSNFKNPVMESDKSWKRRNELGYKAFSGSLIHSLSIHSKQISLKIILINFLRYFS